MSDISERKLADSRLKMLQFADTLGNVSEACRKLGIGSHRDKGEMGH